MTYELNLNISTDSPAGHNIDVLAESEHITREEAALKLLAAPPPAKRNPASPAARRIIGAFRQDAALMDEVLELAMEDRQRRNTAPPYD